MNPLRQAVYDVMSYQWSHSREAMGALTRLCDEATVVDIEIERLRAALSLIAAPRRGDGSWNRDREACRQIADEALRGET